MKQNSSEKKRKSSISSGSKSFHSIQQFQTDPLDAGLVGRRTRFPIRPAINILLILFTTLQVFLLVNSRIYLRGDLVRTFLSVYVDQNVYPNVFNGEEFYLKIINIQELSDHLQYAFNSINTISQNSFIDMDYKDTNILLHIQYSNRLQTFKKQSTYQIDPKLGIVQPFNMTNITDFQLFLLQIQRFELKITNLTVKQHWQGFTQEYIHIVSYSYEDSLSVTINFDFLINDAMMDKDEDQQTYQQDFNTNNFDKPVQYPILYIIKVRVFYGIVLTLAFMSLYLNYLLIRRTFQLLYQQLNNSNQSVDQETVDRQKNIDTILDENTQQKKTSISQWVKANQMTLQDLRPKHYFHILEFDIIFSTLSNVLQIIAGFYLIYGIQKQRVAGLACLLSWMTVFRFLKQNKKLVLMYELIKLSITKVIQFFAQFLPVFISYSVLGVCLFPKVSFYASLSDSVTTLVCLMMGDSIQMITSAITQKNSTILAILYIFTFVLLFMHAIHNTLTSLIKQFFIIMKIDLVLKQKENNKEDDRYIYLQQLQLQSQEQKKKLPLKLTPSLQNYMLRKQKLHNSNIIIKKLSQLYNNFQLIMLVEQRTISSNQCFKQPATVQKLRTKIQIKQQLERRKQFLEKSIKQYQISFKNIKNEDQTKYKESLLTENDNQ